MSMLRLFVDIFPGGYKMIMIYSETIINKN